MTQHTAMVEVTPEPQPASNGAVREALRAEIINTPETADFMAGVPIEAQHQRERWGADHDAGKAPLDWFWLIGYLAQKAATAQMSGDTEKALHHTISTGAALANWHAAISGKDTAMRPGIEPPVPLSYPSPASVDEGLVEAALRLTSRLDVLENNCRRLGCGVPAQTNALVADIRRLRDALSRRSPAAEQGEGK